MAPAPAPVSGDEGQRAGNRSKHLTAVLWRGDLQDIDKSDGVRGTRHTSSSTLHAGTAATLACVVPAGPSAILYRTCQVADYRCLAVSE